MANLILIVHAGHSGPIDFRPAFLDVKQLITEATEANFQNSRDPAGVKWPDITDFTMKHSQNPARDGRPLLDTGHLFEEAIREPLVIETENTLEMGTDVDYGTIHQHGGYNRRGHRVPQRQYRGWNREMIEETKAIVGAYAAAVLRGRDG